MKQSNLLTWKCMCGTLSVLEHHPCTGRSHACSTKAIDDCFWEKDALRLCVLVKVHGLCRKGMCMDLAIDAHEGSHPRRQCPRCCAGNGSVHQIQVRCARQSTRERQRVVAKCVHSQFLHAATVDT